MGFVYVPMVVKSGEGKTRTVDMLVDSGAVWSCLPESEWKALGLQPTRVCQFTLADGTRIERKVSDCRFSYEGIEAPSPVILGERDDVALLGVVTLESLALVLNPYDRTLHPMRALLAPLMSATRASAAAHAPQ